MIIIILVTIIMEALKKSSEPMEPPVARAAVAIAIV